MHPHAYPGVSLDKKRPGMRVLPICEAEAMTPEGFWQRVSVGDEDACWLWMKARDKDGYGHTYHDRKQWKGHRLAWLFTHGPIPQGMVVRHTCDNPPCCNPAHLCLGTNLDNIRDRVKRGRSATGDRNGSRMHPERLKRGDESPARLHKDRMARGSRSGRYTKPERTARGERHGNAVLTEDKVRTIRRLHSEGWRNKDIASLFGVHGGTIGRVVRGMHWQHVT